MLAVTGSTGRLGSRVAVRLAKLGVTQRLIVRDTVPVLTGHKAQTFANYLETHPESYQRLLVTDKSRR